MLHKEYSIFEMIGGEATIKHLVEVFYAKVEGDPALRPLFPDDLEPGRYWQYLFLKQFFGGPQQYKAERGHPRLRMRHSPFKIDRAAQERWLLHMLESLNEVGIEEPALGIMRDYFERASKFLINVHTDDQIEDSL